MIDECLNTTYSPCVMVLQIQLFDVLMQWISFNYLNKYD